MFINHAALLRAEKREMRGLIMIVFLRGIVIRTALTCFCHTNMEKVENNRTGTT